MNNIFDTINRYIQNNSDLLYADLLNNTSKEDILKRSLTGTELTYYNTLKNNDKKRLYISGGNNINKNEIKIDQKEKYISGIGNIQQIM